MKKIKENKIQKGLILSFSALIIFGLLAVFGNVLAAWQAPDGLPNVFNVPEPLNRSADYQGKDGPLIINEDSEYGTGLNVADGDLIISSGNLEVDNGNINMGAGSNVNIYDNELKFKADGEADNISIMAPAEHDDYLLVLPENTGNSGTFLKIGSVGGENDDELYLTWALANEAVETDGDWSFDSTTMEMYTTYFARVGNSDDNIYLYTLYGDNTDGDMEGSMYIQNDLEIDGDIFANNNNAANFHDTNIYGDLRRPGFSAGFVKSDSTGLFSGGHSVNIASDTNLVAANGLTLTSSTVIFGGDLNSDTGLTFGNSGLFFNLNGTGNFYIQDSSNSSIFSVINDRDINFYGSSYFSSDAYFDNDIHLNGIVWDSNDSSGADGYVLKNTGGSTEWVDPATLISLTDNDWVYGASGTDMYTTYFVRIGNSEASIDNVMTAGDMYVQNDLEVDGVVYGDYLELTNNLNTDGTVYSNNLEIYSSAHIVGDLTLDNDLIIDGTIYGSYLELTNDLNVAGGMYGSSLALTGDLNAEGDIYGSNLEISHFMRVGTAGSVDYLDSSNDLYVQDDLEIDGTLYTNYLEIASDLTINGSTYGSDLFLDGDATISGSATIAGDLDVAGTIFGNLNPELTEGSVIFQGSNGLTEDNNNFYFNNSENRLGIGTKAPSGALHLDGDNTAMYISADNTSEIAMLGGKTRIQHYISNGDHQWNFEIDGSGYKIFANSTNAFSINNTAGVNIGDQTNKEINNDQGYLYVQNDLEVDGTLYTDYLEIASDLTINGSTYGNDLMLNGAAVISGSVTIGSDLTVDGTIYGEDLDLNGDVHVSGTIYGDLNPGLETGAIVYQGADGLTGDVNNLFYDTTNNRIGVGKSNPLSTLHLLNPSGNTGLVVESGSNSGILFDSLYSSSITYWFNANPVWDEYITPDEYSMRYYDGSSENYISGLSMNNTGGIDMGDVTNKEISDSRGNLYVQNNLEVDGTIYGNDMELDGNASVAGNLDLYGNLDLGFTKGSIVFQGDDGLIEDNSNFFWASADSMGGAKLGIGTNNPTTTLHVVGSAFVSSIFTAQGNARLQQTTYIGANSMNKMDGDNSNFNLYHTGSGGKINFKSDIVNAYPDGATYPAFSVNMRNISAGLDNGTAGDGVDSVIGNPGINKKLFIAGKGGQTIDINFLTLDSATKNIGFGTTSPLEKFHFTTDSSDAGQVAWSASSNRVYSDGTPQTTFSRDAQVGDSIIIKMADAEDSSLVRYFKRTIDDNISVSDLYVTQAFPDGTASGGYCYDGYCPANETGNYNIGKIALFENTDIRFANHDRINIYSDDKTFLHNYGPASAPGTGDDYISTNLFLGLYSGNLTMSDGKTNSAYDNSGFGHKTLNALTTGQGNSAFGSFSLAVSTTGNRNSSFGQGSLSSNTTGNSNSAFGSFALLDNTTGVENIAFGVGALKGNTTGDKNVALGTLSLYRDASTVTNLSYNTSVGHSAGYDSEGNNNVFLGYEAGYDTVGDSNVFLGYNAGYQESGSSMLFINNDSGGSLASLLYGEFSSTNNVNPFVRINGRFEVVKTNDVTDSDNAEIKIQSIVNGADENNHWGIYHQRDDSADEGVNNYNDLVFWKADDIGNEHNRITFTADGSLGLFGSEGSAYNDLGMPGKLMFYESWDNNAAKDYISFRAPKTLAETSRYIWPNDEGEEGEALIVGAENSDGEFPLLWAEADIDWGFSEDNKSMYTSIAGYGYYDEGSASYGNVGIREENPYTDFDVEGTIEATDYYAQENGDHYKGIDYSSNTEGAFCIPTPLKQDEYTKLFFIDGLLACIVTKDNISGCGNITLDDCLTQ